jgi:hypothetical protein
MRYGDSPIREAVADSGARIVASGTGRRTVRTRRIPLQGARGDHVAAGQDPGRVQGAGLFGGKVSHQVPNSRRAGVKDGCPPGPAKPRIRQRGDGCEASQPIRASISNPVLPKARARASCFLSLPRIASPMLAWSQAVS